MSETITVEVVKCKVDGCRKPAASEGYCPAHYRRFKLYGDPLKGARAFSGIEVQVVGITVPTKLVEAISAEPMVDAEGNELKDKDGNVRTKRVATVLGNALLNSKFVQEKIADLGIELNAMPQVERKPRAKKKKKD